MQISTEEETNTEATVAADRGDRILVALDRAQSALAFINFAVLVVIVALQVLTRFVIQKPLLWSEELARFLLFWLVLNGAALAVRRERHFMIELFDVERVGRRRLRSILRLVPVACILAGGLIMAVYGFEYAQYGAYRVMPISGINMKYVYLAIPLSGIVMVVYSAVQLFTMIATEWSK